MVKRAIPRAAPRAAPSAAAGRRASRSRIRVSAASSAAPAVPGRCRQGVAAAAQASAAAGPPGAPPGAAAGRGRTGAGDVGAPAAPGDGESAPAPRRRTRRRLGGGRRCARSRAGPGRAVQGPAEITRPCSCRAPTACKTGGTWATEQHGGSDVGATTTVATLTNPPAAMREAHEIGRCFFLSGLKWFTSNANSGIAVATARPEGAPPGSAGLGLYLVPSHLEDGSPNYYRIRKLKDKLGTKGLPTGEIELLGTVAFEIAPPPDGFKLMMEALEYSRVHNAVGSAGIQRRALREALAWAKTRCAFGHVLSDYPMVQDELLRMRVEFEAGALLAFEAAITFDEVQHNSERRIWLRLATALAKYLTAEYAIAATRAGLELIGGNGYTSDYPMARLLRDAQVLTVWEGPANIQALELLRLLSPRYQGWEQYGARLRDISARLPERLGKLRAALETRIHGDAQAVAITLHDELSRQRHARKLLHRLSQSLAFALLCEAAAPGDPLPAQSAWRYFETIEPPGFGVEDDAARRGVLELLAEESVRTVREA